MFSVFALIAGVASFIRSVPASTAVCRRKTGATARISGSDTMKIP